MKERITIAMASTHDCKGGAARAAYRLHLGLNLIGCNTTLYCRWKHSSLESVKRIYRDKPFWRRWMLAAKSFWLRFPVKSYSLGRNCDLFSMPTGPVVRLPVGLQSADVINLHWVHSMIDLPSFFGSLGSNTKVVWTLHDMNALTGGCHYSGPCEKYRTQCGRCPELHSNRANDLSERNFNDKLKVFARVRRDQLTIVTPSRWLQACAAASELLGRFRVLRIPYGIDTDAYAPVGTSNARARFKIPTNTYVLLVVAEELDNYRKGMDLLVEALHKLSPAKSIAVLAMGRNVSSIERSLPRHVQFSPIGYLKDDVAIAEVYSAADAFIIPSRQDNLPNTIIESLACGTPVVGFRTGGIPDLVIDGVTGYCAEPGNADSLATAINKVLATEGALRVGCREHALENCTLRKQAELYERLFHDLVGRSKHRGDNG